MNEQTTATKIERDGAESEDVQQIRERIERTQADLAGTFAEIQRRLTWSHLFDQIKLKLHESSCELAESGRAAMMVARSQLEAASDRARWRAGHNAAPLALIGAGTAAALWHAARRR